MTGKIRQIWEALAACFQANDQPLTKGQITAWIGVHFQQYNFNPDTLDAQIYRSCANVPPAQKYKSPKILFFDKRTKTYSRITSEGPASPDVFVDASESGEIEPGNYEDEPYRSEDQSDLLVGLEAQLRDYLAKNLHKLGESLTFFVDSPPSVEYVVEGRRIDILAKDVDGVPVVIELKRKKAYDQVVGQALLYQALVSKKFGVSRVRVILVANEISEELRLASSKQNEFKLFEYELTMQLNQVPSTTVEEEA